MRRPWARLPLAFGAPALVVMAGLAGCSGRMPGTAGAPHPAPPAVSVPLGTSFASATGVMAVVAMGKLSDPVNTFWQLFVRVGATSAWALVTPPGVADNGGLVASPSAAAVDGATVLAGFEPSQDLVFSPLALTRDDGGSWSPGIVPGGLAVVPDALAVSPGTGLLALVRGGGGEVLRSAGDPTIWSMHVARRTLATSAAGRLCGVGQLTAVALDASRGALVGTTCTTPGVVGIFGAAGGPWRLVGPRLSGMSRSEPTKVLRLVDDAVASALVAVGNASRLRLIAVASTAGGGWSRSSALPLDVHGRIVSTGVESGGGFVVLSSRPDGSLALDVETGPGTDWHSLAAPPRDTATVAVGVGGEVDALAVASTRLTDWRLDAATGTWRKISIVTVPIQFGSS